jgi:tetratricopeptide (TPR) repeat protein
MQYKYLYFKGQYRELISDFSKKPNSDLTEYEIAYSIGAYFMLGFMEEGDALYKYEFSDHSAQVIANFFKAMSLMRRSDYVKAKALFVKNYFLARDASEFEFFKFQGLAFYRYYTGDFSASFEHTNRALETCKKYQLDYEQIYVLEILGHIFIQQGKYHKGISIFSRVRSLAIELDCQGISNAIDMNVLGYKLEAGVELNKNINQTITKLKEQAPKEYYLKAQLNLQLSKAHFLNANIEKMEFHLSQAAFNIYKTGNKRQSILLNLGLAHQEFLRGDYQKALFHISNAKQSIIKGIDNVLELKLVGLEIRIMKKLQDEETLSLLLKMEEKLELRYTTYLHKIIKHRRKHLAPPLDCSDPIFMLTRAEDLKKEPNPEFILKVSKLSLLGTLNLFRYEHKEAYAYFNLVENKILIKNHGEFRWSNKGITNFQFQFLKFIFKNKKSTKSEIIKKLWNYQYDSYTHDP